MFPDTFYVPGEYYVGAIYVTYHMAQNKIILLSLAFKVTNFS